MSVVLSLLFPLLLSHLLNDTFGPPPPICSLNQLLGISSLKWIITLESVSSVVMSECSSKHERWLQQHGSKAFSIVIIFFISSVPVCYLNTCLCFTQLPLKGQSQWNCKQHTSLSHGCVLTLKNGKSSYCSWQILGLSSKFWKNLQPRWWVLSGNFGRGIDFFFS